MKFSEYKAEISQFFAALCVVFVLSAAAFGQAGSSSVTGAVTDPQGQGVVGATVTLVNTAQNTRRTAVTDSSGNYTFTTVPPGSYTVEVESAGFNKSVTTPFDALTDRVTTIPVKLAVGDVTVAVTVDAGGVESIKNLSDASLGNNFQAQQISQLPLEGRNVADLLSLQPGVTRSGAVAGGRSDQANITLDGIDVNNQQDAVAFTPVLRVTPDSVDEFRVTTTNPDASRGRSAGAQISLITKSGTNEFHGNLFYYHRNDFFNANNWYNNALGSYAADDPQVTAGLVSAGDPKAPREPLKRHLFGGSFSGPIFKDRLFFFYNYEGMRESKSSSVNRLVPLATLGQGIIQIKDSTNTLRSIDTAAINAMVDPNGVAVVNVNPNVVNLFAAAASNYPSNNTQLGDGLNTGGFRWNAPLPVEQSTHTARFDWNVTSDQKHLLSARMNYQQDLFGAAPLFPDTPGTDTWNHPLGLAASHTWLIKSNLTNKFSYGLTRLAFSNQGDSSENSITFRDIYSPVGFSRTFSRVNPTQNLTDDITWIKGNHTVQFGTNLRFIRNKRVNYTAAYDSAVTNFGFYPGSGSHVTGILNKYLTSTYGTTISSAWLRSGQSSLAALLGRLNQYTARFNFDIDGNPVPNTPTQREFATEEYDFYVQDSWKLRPTLTLNLGMRYGYSTPVYETSGFEAAPNISLATYFNRRMQASKDGLNYTDPLIIELSGKKNGKPPMYDPDKNNLQPRISVAWAPRFEGGVGAFLFGKNGEGVLRGGFAMTNDYYGQQLAVSFDAANTLGFLSNYTSPANTFNLTTNPAPAWDGTGMNIQQFPSVVAPAQLVFPLQQPANFARRIESSIDRDIKAPTNYSTNITFGRELPGKLYLEASYISRIARNLLATRDVMTPNNLRDPISGQTWYEASTALAAVDYAGGGLGDFGNQPFFEKTYAPGLLDSIFVGSDPGEEFSNTEVAFLLGSGSTDWTFVQDLLDRFSGKRLFYQNQYGALDSFGSIANSDYHGGAFSLRQRLSGLTWDLNYTFSHSMDDTSGLQTAGSFGSAFILNPLRQRDNYASSDFDMRHIVNFNSVWQIPMGRGRQFFSNSNAFVDAVIGGWQMTSIVRFNSGQPIGTNGKIFDNSGWVTNWNLKSGMVQTRPIELGVHYNGVGGLPTMFADPDEAYRSFRSPYPGETGDRNQIRYPAFWTMDMGLQKSFEMPWKEGHKVSIRWDVFNVTNTPIFFGNANTAMGFQPQLEGRTAPVGYGQFTALRTENRVMQFALRYDF